MNTDHLLLLAITLLFAWFALAAYSVATTIGVFAAHVFAELPM